MRAAFYVSLCASLGLSLRTHSALQCSKNGDARARHVIVHCRLKQDEATRNAYCASLHTQLTTHLQMIQLLGPALYVATLRTRFFTTRRILSHSLSLSLNSQLPIRCAVYRALQTEPKTITFGVTFTFTFFPFKTLSLAVLLPCETSDCRVKSAC